MRCTARVYPAGQTGTERVRRSFNGRLRGDCMNANWFTSLRDARRKIEALRQDYNEQRPHSSLHYLPPTEFAQTWVAAAKKAPPKGGRRTALVGVERKAVAMHPNRIQNAGHGLNGSVRWKFSIMYCGCPLLAG